MLLRTFFQDEPLTDAEMERLGEFLGKCKGGLAMNIEEVDGFFAALIAGPEIVLPSEYLPEVFGGELSDTCEFENLDEANEILGFLMRHWNTIAATLHKDDVYVPLLLADENGMERGNDWAHGFMRGVEFSHEAWGELISDEKHGGWTLPMLILFHEHDEDPEMRPGPIAPETREEIIVHMAAGLLAAYRHFREQRQALANSLPQEPWRNSRKVGRNDPCPCGSGKKYKRCCGSATIH